MCRKSFLLFLRIINIGLLSTNTPINFLKIYFSSFHLHNYYLILFRGYIDLLYFFLFWDFNWNFVSRTANRFYPIQLRGLRTVSDQTIVKFYSEHIRQRH